MYAPNFSGLAVVLGAVLAVPLFLGTVAVILAGIEGADAGPRLPGARRLFATAFGGLAGCLTLAGTACTGLFVARSLAGCFLAVSAAAVLGLLVAHRVARALARRLDWYRCRDCRASFRATCPVNQCPQCSDAAGRAAAERSVAEFAARWRELQRVLKRGGRA